MGKKTSFQTVQPLTDVTYADLDTIGRCVHFDDFEEALKKGFLVPQPLFNSHTRLSQKVLWFAPCQSMSMNNYYGNVTFVIKWETVQQRLGPYLYLIDQAIYNSRSFTRVVFTRSHYKNLRSVDLYSNESPMIKSWNGFQHATHCMNKRGLGPHELQIGIEVSEDESRWLLQNCSPTANDHSLANTPFTGNFLRKSGGSYKYESYKCYKFNTAQNKECPYELSQNECQDCIQTVIENTSYQSRSRGRAKRPVNHARAKSASSAAGRPTVSHGNYRRSFTNPGNSVPQFNNPIPTQRNMQRSESTEIIIQSDSDEATVPCTPVHYSLNYETENEYYNPPEVVTRAPIHMPRSRISETVSQNEHDDEETTGCQCVLS